jgi:uncharacterized protein YcaQ
MAVTLDDLRRFAVARSFFGPTTLQRALQRLGFVQADPIRSPARAQDLTLRHRVRNYRAGDLERRYTTLGIAEDHFINYGFVTPALQSLMHPRGTAIRWPAKRRQQADALLAFVRERGTVHPREVDDHFAHGTVTNYWGGSSSSTTHLLDQMLYLGMLHVARREAGIRLYAAREVPPSPARAQIDTHLDALADVVIRKYAPLPGRSLSFALRRLRYAAPQWQKHLTRAIVRAKARLAHANVDGVDWYWPADEQPDQQPTEAAPDLVRLLAPFDPLVWDRGRFELLWQWPYRFEAYTPAPKRKWGYYALPLLWRDRVIGWANLSVDGETLRSDIGYVAGSAPRERAYARELAAELTRFRAFLGLPI